VVEEDASNTGLGPVLSQLQGDPSKQYPCTFYSRKLSSTEINYDVELLAMKSAFDKSRHWHKGATHPYSDHKNLHSQETECMSSQVVTILFPVPFHGYLLSRLKEY